jgi:DNA-binding NarL/FixJ family response regulator
MMEVIANPIGTINGSQTSPMIVIISDQVLARTCIVNILKRELTGSEIVDVTTTSDLGWLSERNVRLIAFDIGDKQIADPSVEDRLTLFEQAFQNAFIAVLSNRAAEAAASSSLQRGVRGFFFPTSIAIEVALAGLRLVLAGGVIVRQNEATSLKVLSECAGASEPSVVPKRNGHAFEVGEIFDHAAPRLSLQAPTRMSVGKTWKHRAARRDLESRIASRPDREYQKRITRALYAVSQQAKIRARRSAAPAGVK